jgi:CheY-like chemotaxis protein
MNILLADDDPISRETAVALFKKWPEHQLTVVTDGLEAWAMLDDAKRWFDVAILDVKMPHLTGLEVLSRWRTSFHFQKSLEIVMCTALNDRETITQSIKLGAKHYLVKPFSEKSLSEKLQQIEQKRLADVR